MKKLLLAFAVIFIGLHSCKKTPIVNVSVNSIAMFSVIGDTLNSLITLGTYDQNRIINSSTNSDSFFWNFGNDSTSSEKEPILWYPKVGTYTLTLTTQNKDGQKSAISKQVKVLDRVIKQISINGLSSQQIAPRNFIKPRVWAVIKLGANNITYPLTNSTFNAPIIYQTPAIADFDLTKVPFQFNVPGKIILDFTALATLSKNGLGYKGIGYGIELYAQDSTGTYLISSSYSYYYSSQTGAISWPVADVKKNIFIARYLSVDLICDYE